MNCPQPFSADSMICRQQADLQPAATACGQLYALDAGRHRLRAARNIGGMSAHLVSEKSGRNAGETCNGVIGRHVQPGSTPLGYRPLTSPMIGSCRAVANGARDGSSRAFGRRLL
jgi:hypothetical protein